MKYIVVTGGTVSGIGKGTCISSVGVVLKSMGFHVTTLKIDPYLNVDAGTMSPYEHGEVYVLEDGGEVDLDLGNYERFLGITLTRDHNITTGKIYERVIRKERAGEYLGKTVQVVPHVTNAIQSWLRTVAMQPVDRSCQTPDFCLVEVGGTIGDIESSVYLEALQQFAGQIDRQDFCICHVSFVPIVQGESKTKPTQHSVKELRHCGLSPSFLLCRSEEPLAAGAREKIALFAQMKQEHVMSVHNVPNTYHVPLLLHEQNFGTLLCQRMEIIPRIPVPKEIKMNPEQTKAYKFNGNEPLISLEAWTVLASRKDTAQKIIRIGIVGKYTGHSDSYLSVVQALEHAALHEYLRLEIVWIESLHLEPDSPIPGIEEEALKEKAWDDLRESDAILVPGGFGTRGIEGMISAIRYAREHKMPFLGICLGMQLAVIETCRNTLKMPRATSTEFDENADPPVIVFMPEGSTEVMGGTMRLGNRATILREKESSIFELYKGNPVIFERHRHRYEVNPLMVAPVEAAGLRFVGQDDKGQRMEICELQDHPFFLGVQFHPEFTSRPLHPNPCFLGFVRAAAARESARMRPARIVE